MKYEFTEPFRSQLIRALNGNAPKPRNSYDDPPTEKQVNLIRKLGGIVPESKAEATTLISRLVRR